MQHRSLNIKFQIQENTKLSIIVFIFLFISSMSFWYADTNSNVRHSMNIWNALFEGHFFDFYSYNITSAAIGETWHTAGYEVPIYCILALWNFPLYIIEKIIGKNILNFFVAKVYAKLFFILLTFFVGKLTEKIALLCDMSAEKSKNSYFLFISNAAVFSAVCVCGQIDIIGLTFILLALLAFLKNENIKFYIFYAIAFECKFFALFVFIPLILLREKNIFKILVKVGFPVIVMYMINLPFSIMDSGGVGAKKDFSGVVIKEILEMKLGFMGEQLPYIFILFGGVCILAYLTQLDQKKNNTLRYIYFAFLGLTATLTLFASPYRMIYLIPFLAILFVDKEHNYKLRFLIYNVAMVCLISGYLVEFDFCYGYDFMHNMFWDIVIPFRKFEMFNLELLTGVIQSEEFYGIWTIFYSIFITYIIGFAYCHFPEKKECIIFNEYSEKKIGKKEYIWGLAASYLITNISILFIAFSVFRNIYYKFF